MKVLFIMMTPLYHNTSAIIRLCGYISGAKKNGCICDVLTIKESREDYLYDGSNDRFISKYVNHYYKFTESSKYGALKTKKIKRNEKSKKIIVDGTKAMIHRFLKKIYESFFIYDAQVVNAKNATYLDIDYTIYDRIVSVSDPISSHSIVVELIKSRKIKEYKERWVQCWGDPWLSDITKTVGFNRGRIKKEEAKLLGMAWKIVYASPFTLEDQKKLYSNYSQKMICINQVAKDFKAEYDTKNIYHIGYYGSYFSSVRNIIPLYECCKHNNYKLNIAGKADIVLKENDNIKIIGFTKKSVVDEMEQETEILVSICNLQGNQIPGKVFYQSGYNKPLIIILDGDRKAEMRKYFKSFNRFILCDNTEREICEAIEEARKQVGQGIICLDKRLTDTYCAKKLLK